MQTGSKELIRDINSTLVLETIINSGPISRASISKVLGLTKATISAIVQELMNKELVLEIGSDDTVLGRKPILLTFNKKAAYVISMDIGVETISVLLTDLQGEACTLRQIKTPSNKNALVHSLIQVIDTLNHTDAAYPYGLVGISIGIHGIVSDNSASFVPYYDLTGIDIAKQLEEHFHTSVYLENEANLSVLGEHTFKYDSPNIVNISVHSGIGLGLIINNSLYTGYNGRAGEFGHTIIEIDGRACPCGNHGCLEQYVSERVILRDFMDIKGLTECDVETLVSMYRTGDIKAKEVIERFIKYMTISVNNILNAYNPEIVIINSSFIIYLPELTKRISSSLHSKMNSVLEVVPSSLQDSSILLGGISVVIKKFLGIRTLKLQKTNI